ncbi:PDC sensor domain-containing protein [Streptomyces pseudogriseolus]|uniref:PDC sensor domain-containing protein n=1 Tax=Streptomyces pseudogriseolus TaxID=36817 RepID=UPI003248DCD4
MQQDHAVCHAYEPPTTAEDSGLCARCGMFDHRHQANPTDEQREQMLRDVAETYAAFDRFIRALRPQIQEAARAFQEIGQQLRAAGLIDADGNPTARPDRPAWQSPYGPPRRRH